MKKAIVIAVGIGASIVVAGLLFMLYSNTPAGVSSMLEGEEVDGIVPVSVEKSLSYAQLDFNVEGTHKPEYGRITIKSTDGESECVDLVKDTRDNLPAWNIVSGLKSIVAESGDDVILAYCLDNDNLVVHQGIKKKDINYQPREPKEFALAIRTFLVGGELG